MDGETRGDKNLECWLKIWHWAAIVFGCAWIEFAYTKDYLVMGVDVGFVKVLFRTILTASCYAVTFVVFFFILEMIRELHENDSRRKVCIWIALHFFGIILLTWLLIQENLPSAPRPASPDDAPMDYDPR